MNCPECNTPLPEGGLFCPSCGKKLSDTKAPAEKTEAADNPPKEKKNRKKHPLLIIVSLVLVAAIIVSGILIFTKSKDEPKLPVCSGTIAEPQRFTSHEKIKNDYASGAIDVNTYFTQLFYCEYDSEKLDEKYATDYKYYTVPHYEELCKLATDHSDEIDEEILAEFVRRICLGDVEIVCRESNPEAEQQALTRNGLQVELLGEEDPSDPRSHTLDRVRLSSYGNFLIWYTTSGEDAITEEQAEDISRGLEDAVKTYKELFGIDFEYEPDFDFSLLPWCWKAKSLLKESGIETSYLNTALNIFIYDTKSDNPAAAHVKLADDFSRNLAASLVGTYINYAPHPYIYINKRAFGGNSETFRQLYTHELFHQYQDIYARLETGDIAGTPQNYLDATANLAASLAVDSKGTDNFLNGWASVYIESQSTTLSEIINGGNYGYGVFPYFYVYSQELDEWAPTLMEAHLDEKPYEYVQENTSREDLLRVIKKLGYCALANDFGNNALWSDTPVTIQTVLGHNSSITETINAGSILYYEADKSSVFDIECDSDYISVTLYGYRNGRFNELESDVSSLSADLSLYPKYEKLYIAIGNADIVEAHGYSINTERSPMVESEEFETALSNYRVEVVMDMTVAGQAVHTESTGVIDELHQKQYMETLTTMEFGLEQTSYTYQDFYGGYTYMTQPLNSDAWYREAAEPQPMDLTLIVDKLNRMKDVTEISPDHYRVRLSRREMQSMMSSTDAKAPTIAGKVYVDVYTENGYITGLDYDFSESMSIVGDIKISMRFSDHNNAGDVTIPQAIVDSATDEILSVPEDGESLLDFFEDNWSFFEQIVEFVN